MIESGKIKLAETGATTSDLICPRCQGSNLHHTGATFFARSEDADNEVQIIVSGAHVDTSIVSSSKSDNPSSRRQGMLIHFICETCPDDGEINLAIAQHKGSSLISWRFSPIN